MKPLSAAERKRLIKIFPELDEYDDWENYLEADAIVKLFARKLLAQDAEIKRLKNERELILAKLYLTGARIHVANMCDEELDKSGVLLGHVRQKAEQLLKEPPCQS